MPQLPAGVYYPASQNLHTFGPFSARDGALLDATTGGVTVTITNVTTGAVLVAGAAATYQGSGGFWAYTGAATVYPAWSPSTPQQLLVTAIGTDQAGATVYRQQDQLLWPHGPAAGRYARGSQNLLSFPHAVGLTSATAALQNAAGAPVLPATGMGLNATTLRWEYLAAAALWVPNDRFLATMVAQAAGGTALTTQLWLRDAAQ